jgi:protein TonB
LARVLELESPHFRRGVTIGILGALIVHVAGATEAARLANGLGGWARETRSSISAYFQRLYEVEMVNAPPPPPPQEEKQPEPEAPKPLAAAPKIAPREAPAPAPAQAGKILTQEADPDAPVDLTGQGFVTGNAESYAGGVTASSGTSKTAVHNLNAAPGGVPGGTGTKPGPAPTGPDLSSPPSITGTDWDCPFPPEADVDQIDLQIVTVAVTVRADGTPENIRVVGDPGHGFGRAARACAMRQRFVPAKNREGHPIAGTLPAVKVRFTR